MVRSSNAKAAQRRAEILEIAARRFMQDGVDGVTIPEVMREAGMTQGGFYTHFASKRELTGQAMHHAFEVQRRLLSDLSAEWEGDHEGAAKSLATMYVTQADPGATELRCPISALAGDVARSPMNSPLRPIWVDELRQNVCIMASLGGGVDDVTEEQRARTLVRLATLIGTSVLSRATAGDPLADELRAAVLTSLAGPEDPVNTEA